MSFSKYKGAVIASLCVAVCAVIVFGIVEKDEDDSALNAEHVEEKDKNKSAVRTAQIRASVNDRMMNMEIAELRKRLSDLESSSGQDNNIKKAQGIHDEKAEAIPRGPTPEELTETWSSEFQAQGYDANWAPVAEKTLGPNFVELGEEAGFSLDKIECRENACRAVLDFDSYENARDGIHKLATHSYSINCGTKITLPEPEDKERPYQATLFLTKCRKEKELS